MSTGSWVALGGLAAALVLALGALMAARRRLSRAEGRVADLEAQLDAAERALTRGVPDDSSATPPRLVLEPITAPVVKALAWGAGARHAAARLGLARQAGSR
jgi:hypothetical protein